MNFAPWPVTWPMRGCHMHIIKNQSSMFCSNFFIAFLFFTLHSGFAEAKSSCQGEDGKTVPCHNMNAKNNEPAQPVNDQFSLDALYYSGSILQNELPQSRISATPQTINTLEAELPVDQELGSDLRSPSAPTSETLYSELSTKFQNFDNVGRKKIQRCLSYGSYEGKVDGRWGNQTFEAIIDFKSAAGDTYTDKSQGFLSKIKNVFSNKKVCYDLIDNVFKL
tara:strand:- start:729 stop:1394 length:666 start_codon:yes stop_codon:yes gene_type:complete